MVLHIQNRREPNSMHLYWSPSGFVRDVPRPADFELALPPGLAFNTRELFPASPDRWRVVLSLQIEDDGEGAAISVELEALDRDIDLGRLFRTEVGDFAPFEGFVGVTTRNSDGAQNVLIHEVVATDEPPCLIAPATVVRSVETPRDPEGSCGGAYVEGDEAVVELEIVSYRTDEPPCEPVATLRVVETPPPGWRVVEDSISDGGVFENDRMVWSLERPEPGAVLSYRAVANDSVSVQFEGMVEDAENPRDRGLVVGMTRLLRGRDEFACNSEFDSDFAADPFERGTWVRNGEAFRTSPDAERCTEQLFDFDVEQPCHVYPVEVIEELRDEPEVESFGYVSLTPPHNSSHGNVSRANRTLFEDFRLEVVTEMRDGTIGRPADGMTFLIVGTDSPPDRIGSGGGAMGATGLGQDPTLVVELDDWSGNTGDHNDDNHVGLAWSTEGFPLADSLPDDVHVPIEPRLHNQEPPIASPNRFRTTLSVVAGVATIDLEAIDQGIDLGRIATYELPGFEPFLGFFGATASTGGASQFHIVHSVEFEPLFDVCREPAVQMAREFPGRDVPADPIETCGGNFTEGEVVDVTLSIQSVRESDGGPCEPPLRLRVTETVSADWEVLDASDDAVVDGRQITWILEDGILLGRELSYRVEASTSVNREGEYQRRFQFQGISLEVDERLRPAFSPEREHSGSAELVARRSFDSCGGILCWNVLGPLAHEFGPVPTFDELRRDFLTDGAITERSFAWLPGAMIEPDYGARTGESAAWSERLIPNGRGLNVGGIPTVHPFNGDAFGIDLADEVYALPLGVSHSVTYAQCYVINVTDEPLRGVLPQVSVDGAAQVWIDGREVYATRSGLGVARCLSFDTGESVDLEPGRRYRLLAKVFSGRAGYGFAVRFVDDDRNPITDEIQISKVPSKDAPRFLRGDTDGGGSLVLSDAIIVFSYLFLGGREPGCLEAANVDGSESVEITDGIYLLSYLFLGGEEPPPPFPECGPDHEVARDRCLFSDC